MPRFAALILLFVAIPARADERDGLPSGAIMRLGSLQWRAGAAVTQTAFRNGGRELLTLSSDRTVIVWNVETGRELRRFDVSGPPAPAHVSPSAPDAGRVAVSADGRRLAAVCRDLTLRVFDVDTGREIGKIDHVSSECLPVLSTDGARVALFQQGANINVWELPNKKLLTSFSDLPPAHGGANYVYRLGFGTDGTTLVQVGMRYRPNGGIAPHIVLWDVTKAERVKQIDELPAGAEREAIYRAFPSRDAKTLFVPTPTSLVLMDLASGKEVRRFKEMEHVAASSFITTPDGKELVQLIGRGEAIVIWDVAKGEVARRFGKANENTAGQPYLHGLSISPDGKLLAFGDASSVALIDLQSGKRRGDNEGHSSPLMGAYYSPDGKTILTRADRSYVRWNAADGRFVERFDLVDPMRTFLLSRDAKWVIATGANMTLHVLDAATRQQKHVIPLNVQYTYTFTIAPDSRTLMVLGRRATHLLVFDLTTGKRTAEFLLPPPEPEGDYRTIELPRRLNTTRDARFVVGSTEKELIVWDLTWRREVQRIDVPAGKVVRHVTFGPDSRTLVVEFYGGEIGVWEVASGTRRRLLVEGKTVPTFIDANDRWQYDGSRLPAALSYSIDGRLVANAGPDRIVRLFDARNGREVGTFSGHRGAVTAVSFSPDSTRLVTACVDTSALVWDLAPIRAKLAELPKSTAHPETHWAALSDYGAAVAYDAILALAADPARSVVLLHERLKPAAPPDETRLTKLIADLDAPKYADRVTAKKEIEKLGDLALPALKRVLESKGSAELHSAARRLMEALATRRLTSEQIRQVRAVEVLELAATPEARSLLKSLAAGAPAAPLTIEAKLAVERLDEIK